MCSIFYASLPSAPRPASRAAIMRLPPLARGSARVRRTLDDTMGGGTATGHVCWSRDRGGTGLGTYCLGVYAVPCVPAYADGNNCTCDARVSFTFTNWGRDHDKYAAALS